MAEYINRKEALHKISINALSPIAEVYKAVEVVPVADVQPVKHGTNLKAEWPSLFECSICRWVSWDTFTGDTDTYNYCPNCGARMDGGHD